MFLSDDIIIIAILIGMWFAVSIYHAIVFVFLMRDYDTNHTRPKKLNPLGLFIAILCVNLIMGVAVLLTPMFTQGHAQTSWAIFAATTIYPVLLIWGVGQLGLGMQPKAIAPMCVWYLLLWLLMLTIFMPLMILIIQLTSPSVKKKTDYLSENSNNTQCIPIDKT